MSGFSMGPSNTILLRSPTYGPLAWSVCDLCTYVFGLFKPEPFLFSAITSQDTLIPVPETVGTAVRVVLNIE